MYVLVDVNCNLLDQGNFKSRKLNQILEFCQLSQLVDKPTLITKTLLLGVCINSCSENDVIRVDFCDHDQVYLVRKKQTISRNPTQLNKQNFLPFWELIKLGNDVNVMRMRWKTIFLQVLEKHTPLRTKRDRNKGLSLPLGK